MRHGHLSADFTYRRNPSTAERMLVCMAVEVVVSADQQWKSHPQRGVHTCLPTSSAGLLHSYCQFGPPSGPGKPDEKLEVWLKP